MSSLARPSMSTCPVKTHSSTEVVSSGKSTKCRNGWPRQSKGKRGPMRAIALSSTLRIIRKKRASQLNDASGKGVVNGTLRNNPADQLLLRSDSAEATVQKHLEATPRSGTVKQPRETSALGRVLPDQAHPSSGFPRSAFSYSGCADTVSGLGRLTCTAVNLDQDPVAVRSLTRSTPTNPHLELSQSPGMISMRHRGGDQTTLSNRP